MQSFINLTYAVQELVWGGGQHESPVKNRSTKETVGNRVKTRVKIITFKIRYHKTSKICSPAYIYYKALFIGLFCRSGGYFRENLFREYKNTLKDKSEKSVERM